MNTCEGGMWGTGDVLMVDGVETMFMYFTLEEMTAYLNKVLAGRHLDNENGFYPVGRLATIKDIHVLYDDSDIWLTLKEMVSEYPRELSGKMVEYHLERAIDEEDFGRVLLRKDVLFYHQVLETAMDHFLQALYAANNTYLPSRKRSEQYIKSFPIKPKDCHERILKVISGASSADGIQQSVGEWYALVDELKSIVRK